MKRDLDSLSPLWAHTQAALERRGYTRIVGFMGYTRTPLIEWPGPITKDRITRALRAALVARRDRHGSRDTPRVALVSGGSDLGALGLAYRTAQLEHIPAVSYRPACWLDVPLAPGITLEVIDGENPGDESHGFVSLCDEFIVLGGGDQSMLEAMEALDRYGKPVEVFCGMGGAAETLRDEYAQRYPALLTVTEM